MSRIGLRTIDLKQAKITQNHNTLTVTGPHGAIDLTIHDFMTINQEENKASILIKDEEDLFQRSMWGTMNSIIKNAVAGVCDLWTRKVWVQGVGYSVDIEQREVEGQKKPFLNFKLGYSHPVLLEIPAGLVIKKKSNTEIELQHVDRCFLSNFVRNVLCRLRPVSVYSFGAKGQKGVFGDNIFFRKKEVKKK